MKTVDIVIPYYFMNKRIAKYLCDCLDYQDYKDHMKVYFISDCSYDEKSLEDELKNVTFDYEFLSTGLSERGGPGRAKNIGLEHCKGDVILFWDADDYMVGSSCITKIMDKFSGSIGVVRMQLVLADFTGTTKPCVAIKKSLLDKYNFTFPDVEFSEDVYFDDFIEYLMSVEYDGNPTLLYTNTIVGVWNLSNIGELNNIFACGTAEDAKILDAKTSIAKELLECSFMRLFLRDDAFEFNAKALNHCSVYTSCDPIASSLISEIHNFYVRTTLKKSVDLEAIHSSLDAIENNFNGMTKLVKFFKESFNL